MKASSAFSCTRWLAIVLLVMLAMENSCSCFEVVHDEDDDERGYHKHQQYEQAKEELETAGKKAEESGKEAKEASESWAEKTTSLKTTLLNARRRSLFHPDNCCWEKAMGSTTEVVVIANLAVLSLLFTAATTQYTNHTVGGGAGWFFNSTTNTSSGNYTKWAATQTFNLGDYLSKESIS